jgi:multiple sugar transport system ATP-binding protein
MTMADRIVVMNGGVIEQVGSPLDLYDRPANLFVAGFIGSPSMNILTGRLENGSFVLADGTTIPAANLAPFGNRSIHLGVRPEHLRLDPNGLNAEIVTVEPTGSETQVVMRLGGHEVIGVFRERIMKTPGEALSIGIDIGHVHIFDPETGKRLDA